MSQAPVGIFTISIDLELAWGERHRAIGRRTQAAILRERDIIWRLLDMFAAYDVRATWAIVGHLLVPPAPRNADPRTSALWQGEDIIDRIRRAVPHQEIASHSFRHIPYDEARINAMAAGSDVEAARRVHADSGLPFETFVFPWNLVGHRALLREAGIQTYRGRSRQWNDVLRFQPLGRVLRLAAYLLAASPPTHRPSIDPTGMVDVPDSMLLPSRLGIRRFVPSRNIVRMAVAGLDKAAERGEIFHLWFHPADFAYDAGTQWQIIDTILQRARNLREQGRLHNLPMGEVGKSVTGRFVNLQHTRVLSEAAARE